MGDRPQRRQLLFDNLDTAAADRAVCLVCQRGGQRIQRRLQRPGQSPTDPADSRRCVCVQQRCGVHYHGLCTRYPDASQYLCNNTAANIAKALTSATGWNSSSAACAVGNNPSANNATGFGAIPAGDRHYNWGNENFGVYAIFWSATETTNSNAGRLLIGHNSASTDFSYKDKGNGFSVRCVHS